MYGFNNFVINLNIMNERMDKFLPPTDSRRRPDQRALENGDVKLATSEKSRLEDRQRLVRKYREKNNIEYKSVYFDEVLNPIDGLKYYKYNNSYFE